MTRFIITTAAIAALVLLGGPTACDKSTGAGAQPGSPQAAGASAEGAATGAKPGTAKRRSADRSGEGDAGLPGKLQRWFGTADRPFKGVASTVPVDKLDDFGALSVHVYESPKPPVRLFVFEFADPQLAARGVTTIVGWINRSGLVYHGEATVNRDLVIVVGVPEAGDLDEETKTAVNDFMDAFMTGK